MTLTIIDRHTFQIVSEFFPHTLTIFVRIIGISVISTLIEITIISTKVRLRGVGVGIDLTVTVTLPLTAT